MLTTLVLVSVTGYVLGCNQPPPRTAPPSQNLETTTRPANSTNCECGRANKGGRIINGQEAKPHEYPWQVGLFQPGSNKPMCGGSIISNKHVLTAAHCISGGELYVSVGDHSLSAREERKVRVCNIKKHPNYNQKDYSNDYAVLTLCEPLQFSDKVQPVCLPSTEGKGAEYEGVDAVMSGWGSVRSTFMGIQQPDKLQKLVTKTINNDKCRSMMGPVGGSIKDVTLCIFKPGTSACNGDSGGPLVTEESNGRYTLIGVMSFIVAGCSPISPSMFARVTQQLSWITEGVDYCTA